MNRALQSMYERQGELDAVNGVTACPYGLVAHALLWARGHDRKFDEGVARLPRFGRICRRAAPPQDRML